MALGLGLRCNLDNAFNGQGPAIAASQLGVSSSAIGFTLVGFQVGPEAKSSRRNPEVESAEVSREADDVTLHGHRHQQQLREVSLHPCLGKPHV